MAPNKSLNLELKVGAFVTIGVALMMLAILILGGQGTVFSRQDTYHAHFKSVEGLISGAKVVIGGLQVGTVDQVDFDAETKDIQVDLKITRKYDEWIRKDSMVEIVTQGVLGDKYLSISAGNTEEPPLPPGSEIPVRPSKDLTQFINKGDQLMVTLNSIAGNLDRMLKTFEAGNRSETFFQGMATTAKNLSLASQKMNQELDQLQLKSAIKNLNQILEKVNNGTGTLGALINDPGLYYDAKSLMGGANRNRVVRNLVRRTVREGDEAEAEAKDEKEEQEKAPAPKR